MPRLISVVIILSVLVGVSGQALAKTKNNEYVRTASYFLMSGPVLDQNLERLSQFDLLIIPVEAQVYNKTFFPQIRKLNPDILILPYIATVSWNDLYWTDPLHVAMYQNIKSDWWLTDSHNEQLSVWPNTRALNLNTPWIQYLAEHVKNDVLSTKLWDGIFYDEVQDSISWVGDTDVDNDGFRDSKQEANALWAQNNERLLKQTRSLIGNEPILITNGSSNPLFSSYVNGRMFETFPSSLSTVTQWKQMTSQYLLSEQSVGYEPVFVININTDNTNGQGNMNDYRSVRFGLTTTLLGDGYFSFDEGVSNHAGVWEYDEYDAYLGAPKNARSNILNPQQTAIDAGVWQRDFAQGKVLVNATDQARTIKLVGDFEKLHGAQDPVTNDGSISSEVSIGSKDGIILLRPIEKIVDSVFLNGAFARVYSADGNQKRNGFFAYESAHRGGTHVIQFDLTEDGTRETVVSDDTFVNIYNSDGTLRASFAPYGDAYKKGVNISVGDIENDGGVEIVTGTENGGGPHVRIFNADGRLINPGFFAFRKNFRGGVNISIGDLNGDGIKEIVCGAGFGGGPQIRIFDKNGKLINPGFFAYDPTFRGGVNVSVADIEGDGMDEIITGSGFGGSSLARVYDKDGKKKSEFYVFDHKENRGLEVIGTDIDGDGKAEVIGLTTNVFTINRNLEGR